MNAKIMDEMDIPIIAEADIPVIQPYLAVDTENAATVTYAMYMVDVRDVVKWAVVTITDAMVRMIAVRIRDAMMVFVCLMAEVHRLRHHHHHHHHRLHHLHHHHLHHHQLHQLH